MCSTTTKICFLRFAWVLPEKHRHFVSYPVVVHIDGTNSTNKTSRLLVTLTGRDILGKQFTMRRHFLPSKRRNSMFSLVQSWAEPWCATEEKCVIFPMLFCSYFLIQKNFAVRYADRYTSGRYDGCLQHALLSNPGPPRLLQSQASSLFSYKLQPRPRRHKLGFAESCCTNKFNHPVVEPVFFLWSDAWTSFLTSNFFVLFGMYSLKRLKI